MTDKRATDIAAIAIGRNEGQRLVACLKSLTREAGCVIYVDSGSTDNSVTAARELGVHVVNLDLSKPFTAARARNEGFARLREVTVGQIPRFVQFVDGDCELQPNWITAATAFLEDDRDTALVCGRRRERYPEKSVYNRICDIEWNTPVGEATASGGDFLVRAEAFNSVGGFNPGLIAGEEPDLCFRLREQGWKIWRLDAEMTLHDADMTRFGQWWNRTRRAGYAFANGNALHGASPERFWRREVTRAIVFGGALPLIAIFGALLIHPSFLLLCLYFPLQGLRNWMNNEHLEEGRLAYSVSCAFARIPEFLGVLKFRLDKLSGKQSGLIEYK